MNTNTISTNQTTQLSDEKTDLMLTIFSDLNGNNIRNTMFNLKKMAATGHAVSMICFLNRLLNNPEIPADDLLEILLDNLEHTNAPSDEYNEYICLQYISAARIFYYKGLKKHSDKILLALDDSSLNKITQTTEDTYQKLITEIKQHELKINRILEIKQSKIRQPLPQNTHDIVETVPQPAVNEQPVDIVIDTNNQPIDDLQTPDTPLEISQETLSNEEKIAKKDEEAVLNAISLMANAEKNNNENIETPYQTSDIDAIIDTETSNPTIITPTIITENNTETALPKHLETNSIESTQNISNPQNNENLETSSSLESDFPSFLTSTDITSEPLNENSTMITIDKITSNVSSNKLIDKHLEKVKSFTDNALKKAETIKNDALQKAETIKSNIIKDDKILQSAQKLKNLTDKLSFLKKK